MPYIGTGHIWLLLILLVVVLIIWGPGKLPDVGSGLGGAIREFRKASTETREEFHRATSAESAPAAPAATPATPALDAPAAAAQAMPGTVAEPSPVGGGTVTSRPTEHVAGEGDHPTAV